MRSAFCAPFGHPSAGTSVSGRPVEGVGFEPTDNNGSGCCLFLVTGTPREFSAIEILRQRAKGREAIVLDVLPLHYLPVAGRSGFEPESSGLRPMTLKPRVSARCPDFQRSNGGERNRTPLNLLARQIRHLGHAPP